MAKLTAQQEALLAYASEADDRYRSAKLNARRRAAEMVEREVAAFASARDKAVWDAIEGGVPKRQVGLTALKTTSPNTVQDIYNRVLESQEYVDVELAQKPVPRYAWSEGTRIPAGVYWWLLVDGDDHEVHNDDADIHGTGYLYVRWNAGEPVWLGGKPDEAALRWAEENVPS